MAFPPLPALWGGHLAALLMAVRSHPQGFPPGCRFLSQGSTLCPPAPAHPPGTPAPCLRGRLCRRFPGPSPCCCPGTLSIKDCQGNPFRYEDAPGCLDERSRWPQRVPAKQLGLGKCCLGLQGQYIIPNPHQAPWGLACDPLYKEHPWQTVPFAEVIPPPAWLASELLPCQTSQSLL